MAPPEFVSRARCPSVTPFKERPVLVNAPMVRALLAGTKTQTRRVVKPPRGYRWLDLAAGTMVNTGGHKMHRSDLTAPYGQPGDRLWVRETHAKIIGQSGGWIETDFRATYTHGDRLGDSLGIRKKWTPAIHMPRDASRIDLEVTSVRVERLQQISEADAIAEGAQFHDGRGVGHSGYRHDGHDGFVWATAKASFMRLWDSINAAGRPVLPSNPDSKRYARVKAWLEKHPDTSGWDANPWVWVVEFRRLPR